MLVPYNDRTALAYETLVKVAMRMAKRKAEAEKEAEQNAEARKLEKEQKAAG